MSEPQEPKPLAARRVFTRPTESFTSCPRGHELPHAIDSLECSSAQCARDIETKDVSDPNPRSEEAQLNAEVRSIQRRRRLAETLCPVPPNLTGAEAETYVETELVNLSPYAVAEMKWQVLYGSDAERYKAAKDVLEATGHGKKDRGGGGTQLIIVNGVGALPWRGTGTVVESSVVTPAKLP